ncbi:hypothetical protein LXL04_032420 [Taraxacum kok-saghyz]
MKVDKVKQDSGGGLKDLLDWNMKSRNKFSRIPDLSEQSKQKRSSDRNMPITQFHPSKGDMAERLILKGCSSSVIGQDDHGKVPGVVARLMGLNSLPNSSFTDKHSNGFVDSGNVRKRIEQIEQKHKVIEKFQTEFIPPKSAKSVNVTRQKLLSPIKSSRLVSSNDPPPRKPLESKAARKLKGQSMNKSWDGCLQRKPFMDDGKKSVPLSLRAKINVEKRQGLNTTKKPSANSVLKQNNQKQNCLNGREKPAAKSPVTVTNSQYRKPVSGKSSSKIPANSTNKTVNLTKRDKNDRNRYPIKSNGSDVVSFTFTSPISRTPEKKNTSLADNYGTLLDQKLRELIATCSASNSRAQINRTIIFDKRTEDRFYKDDSFSALSSKSQAPIKQLFKDQQLVAVSSKKFTTIEVETESEPNYVNDILFNIKYMFEDFAKGRTHKIVNPRLFDILEAQRPNLRKKNEGKLRRKLVFDCVSECVDSRCRVWPRGLSVVRRKKRLVKEVCNEISEWERMKDCMVDELVDRNMSSDQWLDFDVEVFEIGVEIERRLLNSLVNEVVIDIFLI